MADHQRLKVTEIFLSLQGETRSAGFPTVFIRLTGCPLRCQYCDTAYAFTGGEWMNLDEMLQRVGEFNVHHVTVTGGEPLAQKACFELLTSLCDRGYIVSLETSGALDIKPVDHRVIRIVDIKTPGSGEVEKNRFDNLACIDDKDQIKFVICNEEDYQWSKKIVEQHKLSEQCEVLFSPSYEQLTASVLADWILRDRLPVRLQIQLHKYLWGDVPGR